MRAGLRPLLTVGTASHTRKALSLQGPAQTERDIQTDRQTETETETETETDRRVHPGR